MQIRIDLVQFSNDIASRGLSATAELLELPYRAVYFFTTFAFLVIMTVVLMV